MPLQRQWVGMPAIDADVPKPPCLAPRVGCWVESTTLKIHLGVEKDFRPAKKAHPALIVDDVRAVAVAIEAAGHVVIDDDPLEGHDRIYTSDPFGNRVELMQPL